MRVHVTTELDAMRGIVAAMESLCDDEGARRRVMRWVVDRYGRDVATVTAVGIQLPVEKPLEQIKERPSWDRERQEPCRCGRVGALWNGGSATLSDGSRHTTTGCFPPPEPVDTMPEPACAHESWEADSAGNASKCTDCGAILPPNWADKVAEPPFHAKRSTR